MWDVCITFETCSLEIYCDFTSYCTVLCQYENATLHHMQNGSDFISNNLPSDDKKLCRKVGVNTAITSLTETEIPFSQT